MRHLPTNDNSGPLVPIGPVQGGNANSISLADIYGDPVNFDSNGDQTPGLWRILSRHKLGVCLITLLAVVAAFLVTKRQTPMYRASTLIEIQNFNDDFLQMRDVNPNAGPQNVDTPEYEIQTQIRILKSRNVLERALATNDLQHRLLASSSRTGTDDPNGPAPEEQALSIAASHLAVHPQPNARVVEVTFDARNPALASDFVNAISDAFIGVNLDTRGRVSQATGEWLSRQLQELKDKLVSGQNELQEYARTANLVFTGDTNNVEEERVKQVQEELSKAQADRIEKQSRYEVAMSAPAESLPEVLDDPTLKSYQVDLSNLRQQVAEAKALYTSAHPKVQKLEAKLAEMEASLKGARANIIARSRDEFEQSRRREAMLRVDYTSQLKYVSEQNQKVMHYSMIKGEVDATRKLYDMMFERVKEAGIASALRASNIRVIEAAKPPRLPYRPSYPLNLAFGLLTGLISSAGYLAMRERANRSIQEPGETSLQLQIPELGVIPSAESQPRTMRKLLPHGNGSGRVELISMADRFSPVAESFRVILTSLLFAQSNGTGPRIVVISSASPGEGKTTVTSNLGIALSQINKRVLLVDGNLRHPSLHGIFGIENKEGLSDTLAGAVSAVSPRPTKSPGLFLLPAGESSDVNLLYSARLAELFRRLRNEYDMILVDAPPLLQMPDARVLGRQADAVVLVVRAQQTTRDAIRLARERLGTDGIYLLGAILNDWNPSKTSALGYRNYYNYYRNYHGKNEGFRAVG